MEYRLLATDLDGTLLNAKKEISSENVMAINRALDMGKQVIFSTGRALGEVKQFFPLFPHMCCARAAACCTIGRNSVLSADKCSPLTLRGLFCAMHSRVTS